MSGETYLLYDNDCGFCRWSMNIVLAWDRAERLRPVAIQDPEGQRLLARVDPDRRLRSWHLALPDGGVVSGGRAVAPVLRMLPGGKPFASVVERFPDGVERIYGLVASNRPRLAKLGMRAEQVRRRRR